MTLKSIALSPSKKYLVALLAIACIAAPVRAQEEAEETTKEIQSTSPDGRLAFLFTATPEDKTFDLIEKKSGKVLTRVTQSDPDPSPSSRFIIDKVIWKSDSSAFALTVWFYKRGSVVLVFKRTEKGAYEEVKLPELGADIPDKLTKGKDLHHIYILNSETAKRWGEKGSLVVEIENGLDGSDGIVIATRTVELTFDKSGKPAIASSSIEYKTEK